MKEQGRVRLADRIMCGAKPVFFGKQQPADYDKNLGSKMRGILESVPHIVTDNVTDFYYNSGDSAYRDPHDYPNLAPPFEAFWMEYQNPPEENGFCNNVGVLFDAKKVDSFGVAFRSLFPAPELITDENIIRLNKPFYDSWTKEGCKWCWIIRLSTFLYKSNLKGHFIPFSHGHIAVSPTGVYMLKEHAISFEVPTQGLANDEKSIVTPQLGHNHWCCIRPALLAISFMHCKNVKAKENEPPAKLSRSFKRRHGRPLVRYYTLEIDPIKQVLKTEGDIAKNGLKKALHICRGHFAHYTPDRPLFGKVTGTIWKPSHVRGSLSEGAVVKDYSVKGAAI